MPQSDIAVSTADDVDDPWYLLTFSLVDGQLKQKKITFTCSHDASAYILPLIIEGREQLAVSCDVCPDIKLLDLTTENRSTAFQGQRRTLCSGSNNRLLVQS